jgi:helix-turn-helix protein
MVVGHPLRTIGPYPAALGPLADHLEESESVTDTTTLDAVRAAAGPIEQIGALYMLHPDTFEKAGAAGYPHPFAGYFAGRGGVLGEADSNTVTSVFAVFEPNVVKTFWEQGLPVHGAAGGAALYHDQVAAFGRAHLTDADQAARIAELGEKIIDSAPDVGCPLFAGWRAMPLAEDAPARAMQVLFILRELRGGVHVNALALSGVTPVEAHMLNQGEDYCAFFGWSKPFADGSDKKDRYQAALDATNRRMAEIVGAALSPDETAELARLAASALAAATESAQPSS